MKRYAILLAIMMLSSVLLSGCAKMSIEKTISEFEDAVNNNDAEALKDIMSPDSSQYTVATFDTFLEYFNDFRDVNYKNLDMDINGRDAEVYADGTYNSGEPGEISVNILFWMRREEALFAFLFPDYKVYRYYDDFNPDGKLEPIWQKLKEKPVPVE